MRLTFACLVATLGVACSAPPPPPPVVDAGEPPKKCVGGVIRDGVCEAKCDASKCLPGNTCVDNRCVLKCAAHSECEKYTQSCLPAKEDDTGADIFTCQDVTPLEYGDPCPFGYECSGHCHTAGPGDARSYCTVSCNVDAECPGGYECGFERAKQAVCVNGTVVHGNSNLCDVPAGAPCVERSVIEQPDSGYVEEDFCLQKKVCLKRESCAPCQSDVDCSWGFDLGCAITPDGSRCLVRCGQDSDCDDDKACVGGHCTPRAGDSCIGGGFCSPCRFDTDCGTNEVCMSLYGNEKACIDPRLSITCNSDADCPTGPSGAHGACLDFRQQVPSTSSAYHRCYAPWSETKSAFSCYP